MLLNGLQLNLLLRRHPPPCLRWHHHRVGRRRGWDPARCRRWDHREVDRPQEDQVRCPRWDHREAGQGRCRQWVGRHRVWDRARCRRWDRPEEDRERCPRWDHREADRLRVWDQVRCHRWLRLKVGHRREQARGRCRLRHPLLLLTTTDLRRFPRLLPCHRPIHRLRHHCHPRLLNHRATMMRRRMSRPQTFRRSARSIHPLHLRRSARSILPLHPPKSARSIHPLHPQRSRPSHHQRAHLHQLLLLSPVLMHPENLILTPGTLHSIPNGARRRACTSISAGR